MSNNRALIVDDSRSARQILGRMLESFGLEVDAVESAEVALTYLQTARPDVIFMDHLMPGMDGFAAVRVIKANPDTATIPVLMYTSQEGEMYLSQARALGAMGVLPKTLKHAEVAEVLQHLNLSKPAAMAPGRGTAVPAEASVELIRTEPTVESHHQARHPEAERSDARPEFASVLHLESIAPEANTGLSVPQLAHRIATEVHAEMLRTPAPDQGGGTWRTLALLASALALILLAVVIFQQYQMQQQLQQLQTVQQRSSRVPEVAAAVPMTKTEQPVLAGTPAAFAAATSVQSRAITEEVAYAEVPLAGARLERLRDLLDELRAEQFKGVVRVEVFMGDFCLSGSAATGYVLAADEVLVSRCDLVGNPFGDGLTVQQRQSIAFANLVASVNSNVAGGIRLQLVDGGHKAVATYPSPSATLTAAVWNAVATRNQRVEFTALPST